MTLHKQSLTKTGFCTPSEM